MQVSQRKLQELALVDKNIPLVEWGRRYDTDVDTLRFLERVMKHPIQQLVVGLY